MCRKRWRATIKDPKGPEVWIEHGFKPVPGSRGLFQPRARVSAQPRAGAARGPQESVSQSYSQDDMEVSSPLPTRGSSSPLMPYREQVSRQLEVSNQAEMDLLKTQIKVMEQQQETQRRQLEQSHLLQQQQATMTAAQMGTVMSTQFEEMRRQLEEKL